MRTKQDNCIATDTKEKRKKSDLATTINIMSFEDAAIYSCLRDIPPTIVISIDDRGFPITPIDIDNPSICGVLKLWFPDTEDPDAGMSEEDARRIVDFVKDHTALFSPEILIHCAAGLSRSAGVAAALCRWLNGSDAQVMYSPHRRPNFLCYERVLDAAGVEHDEEEDRTKFDYQHLLVEKFENHEWLENEFPESNSSKIPEITKEEIEQMEAAWDDMIYNRIARNNSKLGKYLQTVREH